VAVGGRATYRTTAGATVELPFETGVEVVAPVEVTALEAPRPVLGGEANAVTVTVRNNRTSEAVAVDAGVNAPSGWTSGSAGRTIAAGSSETIAVDVTPPLEPAAGRVTMASLAARVTAGDVPVYGARTVQTWAAPSGRLAALALDSGTASSPLLGSYARLAPGAAWDPARGFGWVGTQPDSRDRGGPDALRRDFTWSGTGRTPGTLRVALPAGRQRVFVLTGDNSFQSSDTVVFADGERVADTGELLGAGQFKWLAFELDGGAAGRTVDLRFVGEDYQGYWRLNALVVLRQGG
jgi:alpha-glucuronidase